MLGAFVLTVLADSITEILAYFGVEIPGIKQVFYGCCVIAIVVFQRRGVWPYLSRKLGLDAAEQKR